MPIINHRSKRDTDMTKYQIKEAKGFAVCISKFTVLRNGKIVHRTDDANEAHCFVQSQINMDRDFAVEGR
jgi:hypothetical protein